MARTAPPMGFGAAAAHTADPAGVKASPGPLRRRALAPGREAMGSGRGEAIGDSPLEPRMYLTIDGTGIPMGGEGTEGVRGRREGGSAGTRGGRLAVVYTAEGRDRETGAALPGPGSRASSPTGPDGHPAHAGSPSGAAGSPTSRTSRAPGHPSDAGRAVHPEGPERDRRFAEVRADTEGDGRGGWSAGRSRTGTGPGRWRPAAGGPGSG